MCHHGRCGEEGVPRVTTDGVVRKGCHVYLSSTVVVMRTLVTLLPGGATMRRKWS